MTIEELLNPVLNNVIPLRAEDSAMTVPEWDSFAHVNIIAAIEDAIGEELTTDEVVGLSTVKAVISVCKNHGLDVCLKEAA